MLIFLHSWVVQETEISWWEVANFFSKWTCHKNTLWGKLLTQYGLNSCKRSPPISDQLVLTFWVVAYGMLSCHNYDRLKIITSYPGWDLTASTAANEAMCCKYGGRWPTLEANGILTWRENIMHPAGDSHIFPPRPTI